MNIVKKGTKIQLFFINKLIEQKKKKSRKI